MVCQVIGVIIWVIQLDLIIIPFMDLDIITVLGITDGDIVIGKKIRGRCSTNSSVRFATAPVFVLRESSSNLF